MKRIMAFLAGLALMIGVVVVVGQPVANAACDRNATTATFASEVAASTAGQTICLANGNYGTWTGTNKAITITSASGQGATIALNVGAGDSGFTLASVTVGDSDFLNGANNITVRDSRFVGQAYLQVIDSNIVFDHNTHIDINALNGPARVLVTSTNDSTHNLNSGVTVKNSFISGGDADGLWTDMGATFIDNEFLNVCNTGATSNHTDNIQIGLGVANNVVVQRNFIHLTVDCVTQAFGFYSGQVRGTITDNVIQSTRPWGIELYSDDSSLVAHNTLVDTLFNGSKVCEYSLPCGILQSTVKNPPGNGEGPAGLDPGFGTRIIDNIASTIDFGNGSTAAERHNNMLTRTADTGDFVGQPQYVGGATPTTYLGYCLAAGSPGKGRASDGLDVGIRCPATPPPTTTTTTTTTPTTTTTTPTTTTTTPTTTTTTPPPPTSVTMGETAVMPTVDTGNANLLLAQSATLSQTATLQSLSFYVTAAAGQLYLGVYDATGPNGGPGALKATTAVFTPVTGWNTKPVVTPVSLPAGTYWLAYTPSSNSLRFQVGRDSGALRYYSKPFGALPSSFATSNTSEVARFSFYANLTTTPPPPPPPVTTASFTVTPANPVVGQPVTFDASASNCAVAPCTYKWEDDGPDGPGGTQWPFGTGQRVETFTFQGAGIKRIRVTVTDSAGGSATVMKSVTVS